MFGHRHFGLPRLLGLGFALGLAAGCTDGSGPLVRIPAAFLVVAGDNQSGTVGQQLAAPLVGQAVDSSGHPIVGIVVNFKVVSGGGSVFAGAALTNDSGFAQEIWTLGTSTADTQRVEVRAVDPATGQPHTYGVFKATPVAGPATQLLTLAGDSQKVEIHTTGDSVLVRVRDQYGNALSAPAEPGASPPEAARSHRRRPIARVSRARCGPWDRASAWRRRR